MNNETAARHEESSQFHCGEDVKISGLDISPAMVDQARRLNPGLSFTAGSMTSIPVADGSLGGVCAWYSITHIRDDDLAGVLGEFYRVLVPDGLALVAFQVGDGPRILTRCVRAAGALDVLPPSAALGRQSAC